MAKLKSKRKVKRIRADHKGSPSKVSTSPRSRRVGGAGTRISAGKIDDTDPNSEVRGTKWYGENGRIGIARTMRRDPHINKSVEHITDPLSAADWEFMPGGSDPGPAEIEAADFQNWAFTERLPFDQIIRRQADGYITDGFSLEEMTDDSRPVPESRFPLHPGRGMGIVPTGVHEIPANTLHRWNQSDTNPTHLQSITQQLQGSDHEQSGFKTIDIQRIIRITINQEGANFEGRAVLRPAFGPWKLKNIFQTIDAIKHERLGVGTPVLIGSEKASDEDLDAAMTILEDMRVHDRAFAVFPFGYEFEWKGAGEGEGSDTAAAINRCNIDIAFNVTTGFMTLSLLGKTGSNALGITQQGPYHIYIDGHARLIASAWNIGQDGHSMIKRIHELNYGPEVAQPILVAKNLPTLNWLNIITAVNSSITSGLITADDALEDMVRRGIKLPPRDVGTARERPTPGAPMFGTDAPDETEEETEETEQPAEQEEGTEETTDAA